MGATKTDHFTAEQNEIARLAKALGHPARVAIVQHLIRVNSCICTDVVNELPLAQPTVSQHLRILVDAGLLNFASEGQRSRYQVNSAAMAALSVELSRFADACCREPER